MRIVLGCATLFQYQINRLSISRLDSYIRERGSPRTDIFVISQIYELWKLPSYIKSIVRDTRRVCVCLCLCVRTRRARV